MEFLRRIFGRREEERLGPVLEPGEYERIGTEEDPLRNYEAALERNLEAMEAERTDTERAVRLYEQSVAEGFVGIQPYERLAAIYERRREYGRALRVCEAYIELARSGRMPRGAQRSADRRLPEIERRAERYRELMRGG
ncbi:hypothetical protein E0L93_03075 [Rubrobacter taiwanensis]|jgi:hypothetical protein|uniref:Tetratricopeptide repeat protein n=1 Tax=Rubrobacter taiwanensis TaxID=185139 RepID=A0A4R1BRK8_9ACTN|nr:hypothetical protein [Rubrobacter taiwanensis]TCJ19946.1 hypothetical protein E0L93_03075 [Rubrobacter taiwanensis]